MSDNGVRPTITLVVRPVEVGGFRKWRVRFKCSDDRIREGFLRREALTLRETLSSAGEEIDELFAREGIEVDRIS